MNPGLRGRVEAFLLRLAISRLSRAYPDWARAMAAEAEHLPRPERLRWTLGALIASARTPEATAWSLYTCAVLASVGAMIAYQWSADESLVTLALACALSAALGLLRPSQALLSAASVGLVVFAVNLFVTLTGVRPRYETHVHTVLHDLRWTLMLVPVLASAGLTRGWADRPDNRSWSRGRP